MQAKHILPFLLIGVLVLAWVTPTLTQGPTLRVGVYQNEPLVFFADRQAQGLYIDLIEAIASAEGWKLEYVLCSWPDCLAKLARGDLDLMTAIAYSQERDQRFDFSQEPILINWGQLYTRKGGPQIASILDLEGQQIAAVQEDIYTIGLEDLLNQFDISCSIQKVTEYEDVFLALEENKADAGLVSRLYGIQHENQYNVTPTPLICCPSSLRFAAPEGQHAQILAAIDQHLRAMKEDPQSLYYRSLDHWFPAGIQRRERIPQWAWITLITLTGVALLLGTFTLLLRHQVKIRTRELEAKVETIRRTEQALRATQEDLRQRITSLEAIHRIANAVHGTLAFQEVAERAVEAMMQYSHSPSVAIFLRDPPDSPYLELVHASGFSEETVRVARRLPIDNSISGITISRREVTISENLPSDQRIEPETQKILAREQFSSVISIPLFFGEEATGVLNLIFKEPRPLLTDEEKATLMAIGQTVGLALNNARHVSKLQEEIARRRKAEEALRVSEARYRAVVEDQTEMICRFLEDGTILFVNEAYTRFVQRPANELIGTSFTERMRPEERELFEQIKAQLTPENPVQTLEHKTTFPDGRGIWVQWTVRLITPPNNPLNEYQAVGRDITRRIAAENRQKLYAKRLRVLYTIAQALITTSPSAQSIAETTLSHIEALLDSYGSVLLSFDQENQITTLLAMRGHIPDDLQATLQNADWSEYGFQRPTVNTLFPPDEPFWELFLEQIPPGTFEIIDQIRTIGYRHILAFPLRYQHQVIGALVLGFEHPVEPEGDLLDMLWEISSQLAIALEQAQLLERLRKQTEELETRVQERTAELQRVVNLMAGREIRMAELKTVIRKLRTQIEEAGMQPIVNDPLLGDEDHAT